MSPGLSEMTFSTLCYIPYSHHKELGRHGGSTEKSTILMVRVLMIGADLWCITLKSGWLVLLTVITLCMVRKIKPVTEVLNILLVWA